MRKGEKWIYLGMVVVVGGLALKAGWERAHDKGDRQATDRIPFYSTAPQTVAQPAMSMIKRYGCRDCHSLWTLRDPLQAVPAPALDGMGALHDEAWLYSYLSAPNPQAVLPSRLKKEYRMPSYAGLPESERRTLAAYLASLKVEGWYLEQTRKAEYEKLTGKEYHP